MPFSADPPLIDCFHFDIVYFNDFTWSFGETQIESWAVSQEASL